MDDVCKFGGMTHCITCGDEAIPARLVERTLDGGVVEVEGRRMEVLLDLIPEAKVGDIVLVHAGIAIARSTEV